MSSNLIQMIWDSFLETIIMVAISGGIGALAGIPLGILLFVTDRKSFLPMPGFNAVLGTVINALRSAAAGTASPSTGTSPTATGSAGDAATATD